MVKPSQTKRGFSQPKLTDQQRDLLRLTEAAAIDQGITPDALLVAARAAGYDDLTLDDVRGPSGVQLLARNGLIQFRSGAYYITRAGKEALKA